MTPCKKRSHRVLIKHFNKVYRVYSGRQYKDVLVVKEMLNYRFGDFVFTRTKTTKTKKK